MSVKDRNNLPSTALPAFDNQESRATYVFLSSFLAPSLIRRPFSHTVVLLSSKEEHLRFPEHIYGTWHYYWKAALRRMSTVYRGQITLMTLSS